MVAVVEVKTLPCFTKSECAVIARTLFDRRQLWESRAQRKTSYRNGDWFTIGSALYLDLTGAHDFEAYRSKTQYWNSVLFNDFLYTFQQFSMELRHHLGKKISFLSDHFEPCGLPGFHIFGPEETSQAFFGKFHQDRQWSALMQMPGFTKFLYGDGTQSPTEAKFLSDFQVSSFTLPIVLPMLGGSMHTEQGDVEYEIGNCYMHDGLGKHAIAPFKWPVLPNDYRITLQAHGIEKDGVIYLYW